MQLVDIVPCSLHASIWFCITVDHFARLNNESKYASFLLCYWEAWVSCCLLDSKVSLCVGNGLAISSLFTLTTLVYNKWLFLHFLHCRSHKCVLQKDGNIFATH